MSTRRFEFPARFILSLLITSTGLWGQATNTFPTAGNVGIGTPSPQTTLDVLGPSGASSFTGTTRLGTSLRGTDPAYYTGIDFTIGSNVPWSRIGMKYTSGGTYL